MISGKAGRMKGRQTSTSLMGKSGLKGELQDKRNQQGNLDKVLSVTGLNLGCLCKPTSASYFLPKPGLRLSDNKSVYFYYLSEIILRKTRKIISKSVNNSALGFKIELQFHGFFQSCI